MKKRSSKENQIQEPGEEQLNELIKQAGNQARARKKDALIRHQKMLQDAVSEGVSRRKNLLSI
jgi:vacuolar-type H+-ATPase subunit H